MTRFLELRDRILPQIRTLLAGYITVVFLFFIWRFIFLIYFLDDFQLENTFTYITSFWVAIKLDLVATAYLLFPVTMTIFIPFIGWGNQHYRSILKVYMVAVYSFVCFLCGIDLEWFNEFGNHLNMMVVMYSQAGTEGYELIWETYPVFTYLFSWALLIYSFYKLFVYLSPQYTRKRRGIPVQIGGFLLALVVSIIFARGGFQEKPVDWGYAHFSNNNMANILAQNCIFFLGRSVLEYSSEKDFASNIVTMERQRAFDVYKALREEASKEKLEIDISLRDGERPNIMLIILESFVAKNCNFLNPDLDENVTPFLTELSRKSISFSNCYANGIRSAYGVGTLLCGWPVMPGKPIVTQVESSFEDNPGTESIRMLTSLGYTKHFMYGGDANFDNMKGFAMANEFDSVLDWSDGFLANNTDGNMWGKYDHYLFDRVMEFANEQDSSFFLAVFTTTNHDPFDVPGEYADQVPIFKEGKSKYLRAKKTMAYNDIVVREFLEEAKKQSWYENTIFIFTSDHGLNIHRNIRNHPINGKIPFMIFSELIDGSISIDKIVSQVDVMPTILDLIGEEEKAEKLFGVSGLREGRGFASRVTDEQLQWIEDGYIVTNLIGSDRDRLYAYQNIWEQPYQHIQNNEELLNSIKIKSLSYMQVAHILFKGID